MAHLNFSTIEELGYVNQGHHVKTAVLANATYMQNAQRELFNVYGKIMIMQLYLEATTVFAAGATLIQFNFTSATPVIGVQPICAVSASIANLAQGLRVVFVGGAVATAAVITATAGISDVINVAPHIIGTDDSSTQGIGTIGKVDSIAVNATGAGQYHLHYIPMSDGAWCDNVL